MNKIFKVIWNHATQMWIVVSELTKSHGKSTNQTDKRQLLKAILISITASGTLLFALPSLAGTLATGGNDAKPCNISNDKNLACGDSSTKAGGGRGNSNKGNIAIGAGSIAQSVNPNTATAGNIAMGHNVSALGSASIAIGISTGNYGGTNTIAAGADSYAIGNGASTGGYGIPSPENNGGWKKYDITPENAAKAGNPGALGGIAIGSEAWVMGNSTYGIAIGDNATARGLHAIAYGRIAYAKGNYTIAMGTSSNASGNKAISIGNGSQTSGEHALSIGAHTKASGIQSIAIGGSSSRDYAATASGASSISIGEETNSSSDQTVAIGKKANSSGAQAIALGFESKASNAQAIAIGKSAEAKADKAIAAGHNAKVESSNAVALGNNITVTNGFDNAVILGSGSNTQDGKKYSAVTVNDISYSNFAGHDNVGKGDIVSIGNTTHKRQLVNVAPGAITATSTDAVNGSQLYMVADTVANLAKATAAHLGGGSKLSNNNITAPSYQLFTGKSESAQGGNSNTLLTGSPFTNVGDALSGLNTYINKGFNITNNDNATKGVVTPGDTIKFTNGKNTLSNVKQEAGGVTEITFDIVDTDVTVANGKVATPNTDDGKKLVNATTVAKAINESFWKVGKATSINDITFNNTDDEVKAGDEVRFADGKFTTVSVGNKDTNGKTTNVIKVDVDAQKVVEAAQTPVVYTDKDGNKLIKKDNGKFAKADGTEINPQDVIASINSGGNSTTTPTTLANIKSNLTEDQNGNSSPTIPNPPKKNNAATVSDVLNSGWNLQENGTAKDFVKHGDTVNFANGTGTKVTITKENNGNKIRIDTPLAYVNTDTTDTSTPTNKVKLVGANNGAPVSLSNLASGLNGQPVEEAAKNNGNNAVNVTDLDTALKAYNFKLGGEATAGEFEGLSVNATDDDKQIKKNDTFKLQAGKNIKIKQIPDGYEIATKDQIELGKNDPNGSDGSLNVTSKNGAGVNINGADGSITLTGKPNNGQSPSLKITTEKGQPTINNTPAGGVNRIVYTDNGTKRQVATMDDGLTFAGDFGTDAPRKLGEKLIIKGGETNPNNLSSGNNIGVESNANGTLTAKLAKNLTLGNNNANDGSVGGLAHNLPNPANPNKQDAPTPTPDQHKAATVGDVLNAGFNVRGAKSAGGAVEDVDFVKPYDTIEFDKGDGTEVILSNTDNKKTTVKVNVKTDGSTIKVENNKLSAVTSPITNNKPIGDKTTFTATTPTALVTANTVMEVANKIIEEGLNFAGNTANTEIKRPLGTKLTIRGDKTDATDVSAKNIHVNADSAKNELVINFSEKPEFKEIKLAETGKSNITLNTTGATDSPALTLTGDNNKSVALKNVAAGTSTLNGQHRGDKANNQNPTTIDTSTPFGNKLSTAYNGLADLINANGTNAFTVADARNLGWVVSAQNNNYAADVRNAHEVRFIGTNMATVTGKTTADGVREITVDVNAQKVVETAQVPVVYTDSTGKKLIKSPNGKFYPEGTTFGANGEPENNTVQETPAADVIASMNSGSGTTNAPTTLANVKNNLADGSNQASAPAVPATANKNNAATVGDVLNAGWNLKNNGTAKDFVVHNDNVDFVDGNATTFVVTTDANKTSKIHVDVNTDGATIKVGDNKKLEAVTSEINPTQGADGKPTFNPTVGTSLVTAETVSGVANKIVSEGLDFTGNNDSTTIHRDLGTKLAIKGEKGNDTDVSGKNIYVTADDTNKALVIKFAEKPEFKELKLAEPNKSSITLNTTGDTNNPALTLKGDGDKAVALKNVAAGTTTLDGTHRGDAKNNPQAIDATTPMGKSLKNAYNGLTNLQDSPDTNALTVADAKNLGWVVSAQGNNYADDVRNANEVRFIGTNMATVTGETKNGVREITVDVNAQKVVEAAQTPVVYTDKDGNRVIKKGNNFVKIDENGNPTGDEITPENVIASLNDGKGSTKTPATLANVKSNLGDGSNQTSAPTFNTLNKNNAATVEDVLNSGWDLLENGTAKDFVKHGDKVNFINGRGTKVTIGVANGANTIKFDTPLAYVSNDANSTDQSTPTNKVKLVGADENTPVTLANVASGLNNQPLATAVKNNPNNAVNVSDLNSVISDFNFKLGGKATEGGEFSQNNINDCEDGCIKKDETFVLDASKNIKIKQIANGYEIATKDQITLGSKTENNKEGVDGNLTVTGKDGASVAVDGKDGSITLTGKADNGHTPKVKINTEKGDPTIKDAQNGIDRIVYTTTAPDGTETKRQVATLDDGLVFAGDSGKDSPRKLGEKLTIKGGETQADKLSNNNNIGVVSDGAGNLAIKLAKNLNLGDPNNANNGKISGLAHNLTVPAQNDAQDGPPANVNQHNAATVGDVLNSGWNLQNNGTAKDFVKPYDKVNFVDGANAQLVVTPNAGGTSSDVTVNVVGLPVQYTTKDGTPVAKVGDKYYKVDENGKPITKKADGSDDAIPATDLVTNIINPTATKTNEKGAPTTLSNVVSALKPYSETDNTTANLPKGGLLDLNTKDANNQPISKNNVVTVGDLRKMGWVVSAEKTTGDLGTAYSKAVMNAHEVKFVGTGVATVSGKTENDTHTITVDVNAQDVVNKAQLPVVYTKADGTKVVKDPDSDKFYVAKEDGTPDKTQEVQANEIIASMNNPADNKTKASTPTTLTNLKGNLNRVDKDGKATNPDGSALDPAVANDLTKAPKLPDAFTEGHQDYKPANLNNAATMGDVLNAGWNLQGNGKAVDFVKPFDTVNFVDGIGTTVEVKASTDGKTNTINVNTVMAYTDANGNILKKANDGKYYLPDQVNEDGSTKNNAVAVENPQVNLVNAKDNNTNTPTRLGNVAAGTNTYADKAATADGQPLVKVGDKYYAPDQFTGGKLNDNATPTELNNAVDPTSNVTKAKSGLADLEHSDPNNVMTVTDAKNMGWIVSADGNDYAKDVRNANEVKFVGGNGITVTGKGDNQDAREITISIKDGDVVPENEFTKPDSNEVLVKINDKFYKKEDIDPATGQPRDGVTPVTLTDEEKNALVNNGKNFVTGNKVAAAIQKSGWNVGLANTVSATNAFADANKANHLSDTTLEKVNPNDNIRFSNGKGTVAKLATVKRVDADGAIVTDTFMKFDVDLPITYVAKDADGNPLVKANDGKWYKTTDVNPDGSLKNPETADRDVKTPEPGSINAKLVNNEPTSKDYEIKDQITKGLTDFNKNNPDATPEQIAAEKDKLVQANPTEKDNLVKGTGGVNLDNVAWAEKPDQAVNKDQLDQTVNKSGFFVKQNGSSTIGANKDQKGDDKTEKVTPNDVVDFVNGTNTSVTATTTRENGRDVTKVRVDVTGMPVTYTDKQGNKVAKVGDHYYKVDPNTGLPKVTADGSPDPDSKVENDNVIASMVNPNGETTKPTTLSNVANGAGTFAAPKGEGDKPLKLANDGKWYDATKVDSQGNVLDNAQPVTKPANVDKAGLVDFAKSNPNNAASVGDLQNLGWVVSASQTDGGYTDQVRNTNKVDFVGEGLAKVTGTTKDDGTREIKVSVQTGEVIGTNSENPVLKNDDGTKTPVIKIGNNYYKKEDLNPDTGLPKADAKPLTDAEVAKVVNEGNKGAGLVTGNQVGDAIQNSGWNVGKASADEVNKTTFNDNEGKAEKVNPNDNVRFSDGKNTVAKLGTVKVVDEHGVITTTTTVKVDVDSPIDFKYTDATGKEYVKANDGKFYAKDAVNADGSLKPVADPANAPTPLTDGEIAKLNKGAQLTNGSSNDGVANKAYEVKDPVQAAIQKAVADKLAENPKATSEEIARAVDVARAEAIKANPEAKDKITQGTGGIPLNNVGWATQPDQAVNKDQLDQTVNKAGFFVKQNGESTITGKDIEKVTPNDVVNFINGGNTVAKAETTRDPATGQDRTDVSIHMTGLPLTYTAKDGTPVTKVGDQYFKVNANGYPIGEAIPANELTTNLVNPTAKANEIGAPTVLGNVASGTNTIANKVSADGKPLIQVGQGANAKYYTPDQFENGVLKANATEAVNPVEATQPMDKAIGGLADLAHSHPNNALSVSDASKLGFVVGAKDNQYAADVRNANAVDFVSGNDIAKVTGKTRADGVREIKVTVSKNPVFESVQVGGAQGPRIGSSKDGNIRIAKADGSPSRLTNVAPGIEATDAVNVGQLNAKIGDVHKRINKLDKGMRAGVAGATAVAFLQRPNEAGKSLVSLGVGNFKGQSAVAVGYSRNSDNNKISIKLGSGFNTNGDVNIGGSIGYQW